MLYAQDGMAETSFRVTTNRRWRARDGRTREKTVGFSVTARRRLAEVCNQYMSNGQRVLVVGEMEEPGTWTDQKGNTRASLEVRARSVKFLTPRAEAQSYTPGPSQLGHDWQCNIPSQERDDGKGHTNMENCSKCKKYKYVHITRGKEAGLGD